MAEPKCPKEIVLHLRGADYSLTIDGEEFPWVLLGDAEGPIIGPVAAGNMPTITVTLPADRIKVDFSLVELDGRPGVAF